MNVLDASAFLELLLRTPLGVAVEAIIEGDDTVTPHLFDAEVLHRLVVFGKHGVLEPHEVATGVADLRDAPIQRVEHRPLLVRAHQLSGALSGYDALYAALAQMTNARLVTGDRGFAATARAQIGLDVAEIPV